MRNKRLRNTELRAAIRRHENDMLALERTAAKRRWYKPWRWKETTMAGLDAELEQARIRAYKHALEGGRK